MPEVVKSILYILAGVVIGGLLGFFISKKVFEKQLKENPPITEKQIRAMYAQMGRKPSEADIKKIMRSMNL